VIRHIASVPRDRFHLALMLALTFSTGIVDAVGYLGLDRVFTGNMTGNVVIHEAGPLLALAGFMVGAALGGRVLKHAGPGWTSRTTMLFSLVTTVMLALAVLLLSTDELAHPTVVAITTVLGAAMGVQAATARFIAVKDVTTVVVTSTITGFAADSWFGGGKNQLWFRRLSAIVLIGVGAGVGALLLMVHIGWGIALTAVITLTVTAIGHAAGRPHHAPATQP
jgi:uncharacterized membrane protein YoaK (UPF0700 family)